MTQLLHIGENGAARGRGERLGSGGGSTRRGKGGRPPAPWQALIALVALALVGLVIAPFLDQPNSFAGPPLRTTVTDIVARPEEFYSRIVMVVGMIDTIADERGVTLAEPATNRAVPTGDSLLILSPERPFSAGSDPSNRPFAMGDTLRVIGLVRRFEVAAIEREIGDDLNDGDYLPWDGRPVIVATTIARAFGGDPLELTPVAPPTGPTAGTSPARPTVYDGKAPGPDGGSAARLRREGDSPSPVADPRTPFRGTLTGVD